MLVKMNDRGTQIRQIKGRAVPLAGTDIDTDRIIPARYLKSVTFDGLGEAAFYDERFESDGTPKKHPLNDGRFKDASILIAGRNFGCGSSREHAPQALLRWGIQAIMGGSFAEIFAGNCAAIGVPTVTVSHKDVDRVMSLVERRPETVIHVDLDKKTVTAKGLIITLQMPETVRRSLLNGMWETIAVLLAAEGDFESTAMRIPYISRFPYEPIADAIL